MADELTHHQRVNLVANGVVRVMRSLDDEPPETLTAEDKAGITELAEGLIKIWDGLNATEVTE